MTQQEIDRIRKKYNMYQKPAYNNPNEKVWTARLTPVQIKDLAKYMCGNEGIE